MKHINTEIFLNGQENMQLNDLFLFSPIEF